MDDNPLDAASRKAERRMIMTEFISRNYGKEGYEIIIKTDSHERYRATEDFARRLIGHSKPATNADRIRAMSDEELAEVLSAPCLGCVVKNCRLHNYGSCGCTIAFLKWLKQTAEGGQA